MKEIVLTVGPQGSGKSTFCEKIVALDPDSVLISRDAVLIDLFGSVFLDSYSGGHIHAYEVMWEMVKRELQTSKKSRLILDVWNGTSQDRGGILQILRGLGAEKVVAWYFITPIEVVQEWFWKKPGVARTSDMKDRRGEQVVYFSDSTPSRDYVLFSKFAKEIDKESFDRVVRVNPLLATPEEFLTTQTGQVV